MSKATGDLFKLTYGESDRVIFLSSPHAVEREVNGLFKTFIAINLISMDTPNQVQVWDMWPSDFKALNKLVKVEGQKAIYHVKRCHTGTSYSFILKRHLAHAEWDSITKLELFDLTGFEPEATCIAPKYIVDEGLSSENKLLDRIEKLEKAYAELLLLVESISFAKAGDIHSHSECPF
jgi:hypothetical protein